MMKLWPAWCVSSLLSFACQAHALESHIVTLPMPNGQTYCNHVVDRTGSTLVVCSFDPQAQLRFLTWYDLTKESTRRPVQRGQQIPLPTDVVALTLADVMPDHGPELIYITATKAVALSSTFEPTPTYTVLAQLTTLWPMTDPDQVAVIPPETHTAQTPTGDVVLVPEPYGVAVITPPSATTPRHCHHFHIKSTQSDQILSGLRNFFKKRTRKMKGIGLSSTADPDRLDFTVTAPSAWIESHPENNRLRIFAWSNTAWWVWTLTETGEPIASTLKLPIANIESDTKHGPFAASIVNQDAWWFVGQHDVDNRTQGHLALWRRQSDGTLDSESIASFPALTGSPISGDFNGDGHDDLFVVLQPDDQDERASSNTVKVFLWNPSASTFSQQPWITQTIAHRDAVRFAPPLSQPSFITAFPVREAKTSALLVYQQKDRLCASQLISQGAEGSLTNQQTLLNIDPETRCQVLNFSHREILIISDKALQWCQLP